MSGREREYESGLKIGLHPLVHPHSGQAEQEMLGRYSALWLEEREEHQSPWCVLAFSHGVHCWPDRFVITQRNRRKTKNSTYLWWWGDDGVSVKEGRQRVMEKAVIEVNFTNGVRWGTCFLSTCFYKNRSCGHIHNTFIHQSSSRKTLITASLKSSWHCIDLWKQASKFLHTKAILRVGIYHYVLTEASNISRCCWDCAALCLFRVAHIVWNSFHLTFMLFLRDQDCKVVLGLCGCLCD